MFRFCVLVVVCAVANVVCQLPAAPYDIRIDHYKVDTTKDLVINTARPRFSWKLSMSTAERNVQQKAYQLQIKSRTDQWDSQKVMSNQSIHVSCMRSNDLQSATFYQFRLRIWTTQSDQASSWTDWMHFRTSIFYHRNDLLDQSL